MLKRILLLTVFLLFVYASTLLAAAPPMMNYQGILTNASGNPLISTSRTVQFTIYDDPSAGTIQWAETLTVNTDASGRFNKILGEVHPLTDVVFSDTDRYLGLTVASDPELSPRSRIVSVGYANRVSTVDGATGGTITGDVTLNSTLTADNLVAGDASTPGTIKVENGTGTGLALYGDPVTSGYIEALPVGGGFPQAYFGRLGTTSGSVYARHPITGSYVWMNGDFGGTQNAELQGSGAGSYFSLNTFFSGDGAVALTTDAISSPEILDEPGVAGNSLDAFVPAVSVTPMLSRTITCPSSGYVLAVASCEWDGFHTTGTATHNQAALSASSSTIPSDQELSIYIDGALPSAQYLEQLASVEIFPVAPGVFTVYYNCFHASGAFGAFYDINLELLYVPTTYGTVSALAGSAEPQAPGATPNQSAKLSASVTPVDSEAEKAQSIADNQARIEKELADMKTQLEELKKQLGQQGTPKLEQKQ